MPGNRLSLTAILLAQFVIPLSISGTAVALPAIADDVGAAPGPLQWVVNGFNVSFAVFTIVWGAASDRIGYTRAFRLGTLTAAVGGLVSACAPGIGVLDLGRIIAGVGSAAVLTGATPILSQLFDGPARTRAFALFGTVNGLGLAAGPALSGLVQSAVGWRGIFMVHAVVLVIALSGTARLPQLGQGARSMADLLDFSALREPRFLAMALVPVAAAVGFVSFLTYLPTALGAVHGMPVAGTGAFMLVMTVPLLGAPSVVHRLLTRTAISPTTVVAASFGCLVLGGAGVLWLMRPDVPVGMLVVPMALLGLGFGLPLGFVDAEALAAVPDERAGAASGVINLLRVGSEAVFVAVFGWIISTVVRTRLDGETGDAVAAGATGHPGVYYDGFVAASAAMVILVLVIGALFLLCSRKSAAR